MSFIVRVSWGEAGQATGTVERAASGEKRRFTSPPEGERAGVTVRRHFANYSGQEEAQESHCNWHKKGSISMQMMFVKSKMAGTWGKIAVGLAVLIALTGAVFGSFGLAAPASRVPSMAMESGTGQIQEGTPWLYSEHEFEYPELRHVSLTVAVSPSSGRAAAIVVWPSHLTPTGDTPYALVAATTYDLPHFTVEFDAYKWKMGVWGGANATTVTYSYTVTYPKP